MEVLGMQVLEEVYDPHKVRFNGLPTSLEEGTGEPVRPGGFVRRHLGNGLFDLILREVLPKTIQDGILKMDTFPNKVTSALVTGSHGRLVVIEDKLLFSCVVCDPPIVVLKPINVVFPSSSIDPSMKKFRICIPFPNVLDADALFFS
jgi:hypothetical protein